MSGRLIIYIRLLFLILLLVSPALAVNVYQVPSKDIWHVTTSLVASVAMFILPIGFFHNNIRRYFYLLLPVIALTPLLIFSTLYLGITPGFELIAFILQTNPREAKEAVGPFLVYLIPLQLIFVALYCLALYGLPPNGLSLKQSIGTSVASLLFLAAVTVHLNGLYGKKFAQLTRHDLFLKYDYPFSLLFGAKEASAFLRKNNLDDARDFVFRAVRNDTISQRRVCVLIIGESSRYDRWQINGYHRPTSPRLAARSALLTYSDVVAGAHYTWVSIPQIITRAHPDNYNLQYREKSILSVFREAGFHTYWLSNQSDQDIFWSGSIILHAKTADYHSFSPTYSPNLEYEAIYDGRLLPLVDSVLKADQRDLFIVMHTIGNHWDYSQRYPADFDVFQPSGYTEDINPPHSAKREALLNSYDNSILYADYIIDSVISMVDRVAVSTVVFISDHGEDLFDADPTRMDFHFRPSAATLRVPLFIWGSESYRMMFADKWRHLEANVASKVGTENIFYTVVDMANLGMETFDPTKSLAHPAFLPSPQKFYDDDKKARLFMHLP